MCLGKAAKPGAGGDAIQSQLCELFMFCAVYPPKVTVYFPEKIGMAMLDPVQSERPQENYKIEWKKQTAPT